MNKIKKHIQTICNSRGFSLLEVLLGITVFMIGMLGVTALNISSLKSNTFSGNLTEATLVAASKIEELMNKPFDPVLYPPNCDEDATPPVPVEPSGADWSLSYTAWENKFNTCFDLSDRDDDGNRITLQDTNDDGEDNDGGNFGLDDFGNDADYGPLAVVKNNITYNVYWNVAENEPISINPQRTKLITVIVEWTVKDEPRRISMSTIRQKE
jgi:hypothetical protein